MGSSSYWCMCDCLAIIQGVTFWLQIMGSSSYWCMCMWLFRHRTRSHILTSGHGEFTMLVHVYVTGHHTGSHNLTLGNGTGWRRLWIKMQRNRSVRQKDSGGKEQWKAETQKRKSRGKRDLEFIDSKSAGEPVSLAQVHQRLDFSLMWAVATRTTKHEDTCNLRPNWCTGIRGLKPTTTSTSRVASSHLDQTPFATWSAVCGRVSYCGFIPRKPVQCSPAGSDEERCLTLIFSQSVAVLVRDVHRATNILVHTVDMAP